MISLITLVTFYQEQKANYNMVTTQLFCGCFVFVVITILTLFLEIVGVNDCEPGNNDVSGHHVDHVHHPN